MISNYLKCAGPAYDAPPDPLIVSGFAPKALAPRPLRRLKADPPSFWGANLTLRQRDERKKDIYNIIIYIYYRQSQRQTKAEEETDRDRQTEIERAREKNRVRDKQRDRDRKREKDRDKPTERQR